MTVENVKLIAETPGYWRARRTNAPHRLICFPHAGAGAGSFTGWAGLLPPEIELVAAQLPGRQNRIAEDPATEVGPLVKELIQELEPVLTGSFAFFGHSCGAILAFEVARALHAQNGPNPSHLFLSAQPAPGTAPDRVKQLSGLSDQELVAEMVSLGGLLPEIASNQVVMSMLLPTVRADFDLWENHELKPGPLLDCPITALLGERDPRSPVDTVDGWRDQTTGRFQTRLFDGGHFYFLAEPADVVGYLGQTLLDT
jgi:surfactin synthase thioesterase subunit